MLGMLLDGKKIGLDFCLKMEHVTYPNEHQAKPAQPKVKWVWHQVSGGEKHKQMYTV